MSRVCKIMGKGCLPCSGGGKPSGDIKMEDIKDVQYEDIQDGDVLRYDEEKEKRVTAAMAGGDSVLSRVLVSNVELGGISIGTTFDKGTSLEDILRLLLNKYIKPVVTLTSTTEKVVSAFVPLDSIQLTTKVTKGTSDIVNIKTYAGSELIRTQSVAGTFTYSPANPIKDDITFKAVATDTEGEEGSATYKVDFVVPFLYGSAKASSLSNIDGLSQIVKVKGEVKATFNTDEEYIYFMYDSAYGSLSSVKDVMGNENLQEFTKLENIKVTKEGTEFTLCVYRSNEVQSVDDAELRFIF